MRKSMYEALRRLTKAMIDENGRELLNPEPLTHSPGIKPAETMDQKISRIVHHALRDRPEDQRPETFEEATDFDIDDDDDMPIESLYQMLANAEANPAASDLDQAEPIEGGADPGESETTNEKTPEDNPDSPLEAEA